MSKILVVDKETGMSSKEEELARLQHVQKNLRKGRISQDSRDRLKKISHKKFRTCFIAALSEFEKEFGIVLWGHGLPDDQITDDQRANREVWERVRKNILDKGNAQSRALSMELDLHNIEFEGYKIKFGGRPDGK